MKIRNFFLCLMVSFCFVPRCWAQMQDFKSIPILQDGRLKPLDTYARDVLLQFSGRETYEGKPAIQWLAGLLFAPQKTIDDKVILINDPEIAVALDIKPESSRRYSFRQMAGAYQRLVALQDEADKIDEHDRSLAENEILRVAQNVELYIDLSDEFLWTFPDADFTVNSKITKHELGLPLEQNQFSFIDIALRAAKIKDVALKFIDKTKLSASQKELMTAVLNMFHRAQTYKNLPLDVIPLASGDWVSPWDAISQDFSDPQTKELIMLWQRMALAYSNNNMTDFDTSAYLYRQAVRALLPPPETKTIAKFPLELAYHAAMPFLWARIFYILAFIFFIISFTSTNRLWYALGLFSVVLGFLPHAWGLVSRIVIMGRPPVSSLYETFIFVSFITVLLGLTIEYFNRQWLGIVTAAISGTVLLFIAGKYSAEGDTLKMIVAVLNSNFWLATHVTTITMGYGATCVAGILGHIWLVQAALGKKGQVLDNTYKTTLGIMGVALTLTFLGTNLGGIWADQSWGRFWGWDPKENGALMIVLWLALLFHAKFAKMVGPFGLAIGCVIAMMVVMWAWFGVNLLSIGLHSYGFTSGIANALIAYAVAEVLFIVLTSVAFQRRPKA